MLRKDMGPLSSSRGLFVFLWDHCVRVAESNGTSSKGFYALGLWVSCLYGIWGSGLYRESLI